MAVFRELAHRCVSVFTPSLCVNWPLPGLVYQDGSGLRHARKLIALITMQKMLAGMKPSCAVLKPITHMTTLLMPANAQPSQYRLPTRIVETMVNTQDR